MNTKTSLSESLSYRTLPNKKAKQPLFPLCACIAWLAMVASSVGQTTITWQEDWENPLDQNNWAQTAGTWQIGVPTYGPPTNSLGQRAYQGTGASYPCLNQDIVVGSVAVNA